MTKERSRGAELARDPTVYWFWGIVAAHVVVWTLLPTLTQPNAPLDVVEMLFFGREWQWGYFKHPPLPAWLAEAAFRVCGGRIWGVSALAQLCVVVCFWSVWRLGRLLLGPRLALGAAALLEVSWSYTGGSTEFNHNVCLYPFWTLAILLAYRALEDGRLRFWAGSGVALGLAVLAKYTAAVLAATMLMFLLLDPSARRSWRRPGPAIAIAATLLVVLPHLAWAAARGFPAIDFALKRTHGGAEAANHLLAPLVFAGGQMASLLPTALVLLPLAGWPLRLRPLAGPDQWRRRFLVTMVAGPFVLCLLLAAVRGLWFSQAHGSQLWPYAGLLALSLVQTDESPLARRRAVAAWAASALVLGAVAGLRPVVGPHLRHKPSRVHFPGPSLAAEVEDRWRARHGTPLPAVAGEWWLAGNVALYGPSRAAVWGGSDPDTVDFGSPYGPWLDEVGFRRYGGAIVWNAETRGAGLPHEVATHYADAEVLPPLSLRWQTAAPLRPVAVGVALVPPRPEQPAGGLEGGDRPLQVGPRMGR